jgi:hypothetical protein
MTGAIVDKVAVIVDGGVMFFKKFNKACLLLSRSGNRAED